MKRKQKRQSVLRSLTGAVLVPATMLISACQTPSGSCDTLILREYDMAFRQQMQDERRNVPRNGAVDTFIADAITLRDDVRACKK